VLRRRRFDAENLFGALRTYKKLEQSTLTQRTRSSWARGFTAAELPRTATGSARCGSTPRFVLLPRSRSSFPFFEFHLKGQGGWKPPDAWVFETGTNVWRSTTPGRRKGSEERHYPSRPAAAGANPASSNWSQPASDTFDEYVSDPNKPIPLTSTRSHRHGEGIHDPPTSASLESARCADFQTEPLTKTTRSPARSRVKLYVSKRALTPTGS